MHIGWGELLIVVAIVLLIVGGRRLPELGRSLGQAIREFQEGLRGKPKGPKDNDRPSSKH